MSSLTLGNGPYLLTSTQWDLRSWLWRLTEFPGIIWGKPTHWPSEAFCLGRKSNRNSGKGNEVWFFMHSKNHRWRASPGRQVNRWSPGLSNSSGLFHAPGNHSHAQPTSQEKFSCFRSCYPTSGFILKTCFQNTYITYLGDCWQWHIKYSVEHVIRPTDFQTCYKRSKGYSNNRNNWFFFKWI